MSKFGTTKCTCFPFRRWYSTTFRNLQATVVTLVPFKYTLRAFAITIENNGGLGATYPCTNAVDMEPLSASQLKVIHQSTCYYHQDLYYWRLRQCSRKCLRRAPAHHSTRQCLETRNVTRALTAMHRERAIESSIFRVTRFGRMSSYTLLSGYRLP